MALVEISDLKKHFKILNRREGLLGSIRDLFSRNYRTIKAVDGINFNIEKGEIVGFLGPNGAGKSTTIKMLIGVLQPSSGVVKVREFTPFSQRKKYVRHIGVVLGQRTQLWWDLPVIESFKLLKEIYEIPENTYQENLKLFDDLLNISELYMKPVRNLSLGQRMLCDIAASFLHDPEIIFLDEPTIGLDVSVKNKVRKIIRDLNEVKKTTIVLTSHDVGDIESLSKRIILIDKGKLLYDGDVQQFNKIFGNFRTLKVAFHQPLADRKEEIMKGLVKTVPASQGIRAEASDEGWLTMTVNEEKLPVAKILNFFMENHSVKDIKIEEIAMEQIIEKVYEGALK